MSSRRLGLLLGTAVALSNSGCILLLLDDKKDEPPQVEPPPPPSASVPPVNTTPPSVDPPPSVDSIRIPDWPPLGPDSSIEVTVTDNRGLARLDLIFAKTYTRPISGSFNSVIVPAVSLGEGFGELVVRATDINNGWAERIVTGLLVDLSPPTIQLFGATVPATGEGARLDVWVADAWVLGSVELVRGGALLEREFPAAYPSTLGKQWDGSIVSFDATSLPLGRGPATVTARDAAGNETVETFDLHVDGVPPIAKITSPAPDSIVTGRFDVVIEASDELGGRVWVDVSVGGAPVASSAGSATVSLDAAELAAGPTEISAIAVDEAGNESEAATVSVQVVH